MRGTLTEENWPDCDAGLLCVSVGDGQVVLAHVVQKSGDGEDIQSAERTLLENVVKTHGVTLGVLLTGPAPCGSS